MRVVASGTFLSENIVLSTDIDRRIGEPPGTVEKRTGVRQRHFASTLEPAVMAADAIRCALSDTGYQISDIDLVINASSTPQQLIPSTATFILRELGAQHCFGFDLDATCVSFLAALDMAEGALRSGRYKRICIVSSEISSLGINWNQPESAGLFGDAAVAFLLERDDSNPFKTQFQSFPEGHALCQIVGGGTALPGYRYTEENLDRYLFDMDGPGVYRFVTKFLPVFVDRFLDLCEKQSLGDFDAVVPHQASQSALELLRRKFRIPVEKYVNVLAEYGNCIAASIPLALHEAMRKGQIKRGDEVALVGTGAGVAFGAICLRI